MRNLSCADLIGANFSGAIWLELTGMGKICRGKMTHLDLKYAELVGADLKTQK